MCFVYYTAERVQLKEELTPAFQPEDKKTRQTLCFNPTKSHYWKSKNYPSFPRIKQDAVETKIDKTSKQQYERVFSFVKMVTFTVKTFSASNIIHMNTDVVCVKPTTLNLSRITWNRGRTK